MRGADLEVLQQALHWLEAGWAPLLVTVVHTWGSTPRPAGSLLVMCAQGSHAGSVSGGCIESDLLERCRAGEWQALQAPQLVSYGVTQAEANRFGLPCGGRLDLLLEPLALDAPQWQALYAGLERGEVLERCLNLASGQSSLKAAPDPTLTLHYDTEQLRKVYGPQWRILLIGANHLARYVARFALALDYQVLVCDPRADYAQDWELSAVPLLPGMPDDVVRALGHYQRSCILTLTHDPKLDDMALMEALLTDAFYIGALGSVQSSRQRRARLLQLDIAPERIARLHAPVGLPLGSRTPAEIAVAIMADLTAQRYGRQQDARDALRP